MRSFWSPLARGVSAGPVDASSLQRCVPAGGQTEMDVIENQRQEEWHG